MRRTTAITTLLSCSLLLPGCSTGEDHLLSAYPELRAALLDFQRQQRTFAEANPVPQTLDFPGAGQVTVRDVSLEGYPGGAFVRCRFVYQNTTDRPVVRAWVSLDVLDPSGAVVGSQISVCIVPVPIPIAQGSFFADELRTRTMDAHLLPGWSWRVTCRAELQE